MTNQHLLSEKDLASLKKIGQAIKNRREEISCSVMQLSEVTRIPISDIRAIEQGLSKEYPEMVFLKGFIRSCCNYLNLDSQWMIDILDDVFSEHEAAPVANEQFYENTLQNPASDNVTLKSLVKAALASSLLVIIVLGGYFIFKNYLSLNEKEIVIPVYDEDHISSEAENFEITPIPTNKVNLILVAQKAGWVSVKVDEQEEFYLKLEIGDIKEWDANDAIKIVLSRGDLAKITINGEEELVDFVDYDKLYEKTFSM